MNHAASINQASPLTYRNGVLVLRTQRTESTTPVDVAPAFYDDDLDVITPMHRHRLRYVVREL